MTSAVPPYLTPATKTMLYRKNRLMRRGRLEEASALASRIGIATQKANSKHLQNIDLQAGPADLWKRVNQVINKRTTDGDSGTLSTTSLNDHYARTSYDNGYPEPLKKLTVLKHQALVSEYRMFVLLDRLHHTTDGLDSLPMWFLHLVAPDFLCLFTGILGQLLYQLCYNSRVHGKWPSLGWWPRYLIQSRLQTIGLYLLSQFSPG